MFLKSEKQFWEIQFDIFDLKFSRFTSSFGFSSKSGIWLQLYSFQIELWSGVILSQSSVFLLLHCQRVLCVLEVFKIKLLVWFAKGSVFLEGFKVTTLVCGVCNLVWLLSGLPSGFWKLDVALAVRVN